MPPPAGTEGCPAAPGRTALLSSPGHAMARSRGGRHGACLARGSGAARVVRGGGPGRGGAAALLPLQALAHRHSI